MPLPAVPPAPVPPAAPGPGAGPGLLGVDFSSAPSRRKPVVAAEGELQGAALRLRALHDLPSLAAFEALLRRPGPWLGAFDLPFGLPRAFVDALVLGRSCAEVAAAVRARCPRRMDFRALVEALRQRYPALTAAASSPG